MTTLQWKRGTTEKVEGYAETALEGELVVDTATHRVSVYDGAGGRNEIPLLSDVKTTLASLTNDISAWSKSDLTKVSQLSNDLDFWSSGTLSKVSQLQNDSGFKTGYCTHCQYCQHCQQCSNCHNCNTTQCTTVNCSIQHCLVIYCLCNCDCTDDS
jgi:hypothetical protein|nr:MAG TPA: major tropism determinant [Caudoviricetes sp.]DAL96861.1 MAG TPA: major tropism determinant [Caudoviricetes sp.]